MKEYPIQIMTLKDLLRLQSYVRANHLRGEVRQKNYACNVRSSLYMAIALPLDAATLYLKDCPAGKEADLVKICHVNA